MDTFAGVIVQLTSTVCTQCEYSLMMYLWTHVSLSLIAKKTFSISVFFSHQQGSWMMVGVSERITTGGGDNPIPSHPSGVVVGVGFSWVLGWWKWTILHLLRDHTLSDGFLLS